MFAGVLVMTLSIDQKNIANLLSFLVSPSQQNKKAIPEEYSKPCQTTMIELFTENG